MKNIEIYDVYNADEAFMTGTPFSMLPVTSLNGLPISDKKVGPIFKSLITKWGANTDTDIIKQIQNWGDLTSHNINAPTPYKFKLLSFYSIFPL